MAYKKDSQVRNAHPGWAVRFVDNTWLGGAHGWFRTDDAFFADIYSSKEDGERYLTDLRTTQRNFYGDEFDIEAEVIPAWEPICETLRHDVIILKQTNIVEFGDVLDVQASLQNVMDQIKTWQRRGKEAAPYRDEMNSDD